MTGRVEKLDKLMVEQELKLATYLKHDDEMLKRIEYNEVEIHKLEAVRQSEETDRERRETEHPDLHSIADAATLPAWRLPVNDEDDEEVAVDIDEDKDRN